MADSGGPKKSHIRQESKNSKRKEQFFGVVQHTENHGESSLEQPARFCKCILTIYMPYDVFLHKEVPFLGTAPHIGGEMPQNIHFRGVDGPTSKI